MHAINANFNYGTNPSFHVGLSNAFVLTVLKRQYCVRTSVNVSLASVKHISRW